MKKILFMAIVLISINAIADNDKKISENVSNIIEKNIYLEKEKELIIEDWMLDNSKFTKSNKESENEKELKIENWMIDSKYFESKKISKLKKTRK